jgi:hypothetical protein
LSGKPLRACLVTIARFAVHSLVHSPFKPFPHPASQKHLQTATVPAGGIGQVHFRPGGGGDPTRRNRIKTPSPCAASLAAIRDRAAALDCGERSGKHPKNPLPPLLRSGRAVLCVLCGFLSFGTVIPCCAHCCRLKPFWQRSVPRVIIKLRRAHAVEKIVQAHLLCAINPLSRRVDLAVRLDSRDNRAGRHVHFARLFDDPLQRCPDVALASLEQSKRVRVPVDARPVCQPEILSNGRRRAPADEDRLNLFPLLVSSNRASPLVPAKAHRSARRARLAHAAIVVLLVLRRKVRWTAWPARYFVPARLLV